MQYFHLEQPFDELILCDREDCEAIADYLEVEDDGNEHRLCSFHTRNTKPPVFLPAVDLPYRSKPVI